MRRPSVGALLLIASGCTGRPPRYPITDPAMALRHVTARLEEIQPEKAATTR